MDDYLQYLQIVQKSPLAFKFKRCAPLLFDDYRNFAKIQYPDYPFKADLEELIIPKPKFN
ncbi:MAG: hypothetical protein RIT35_1038 [Pseudomonadota bacterium]|jgi:hypothetical protein